MAKKKNKRKSGKQHLGQKDMIQRYHKERMASFSQKVLDVLHDIHAKEILAGLSTENLRIMYMTRFQSPKVESAEGLSFPAKLIKTLQNVIDHHLENNFFSFPGSDQKFSYHDYFNVVLTLKHWVRTLEEEKNKKKKTYLNELSPLLDFCATSDTPEEQFNVYLHVLSTQLTLDPFKAVYYMTCKLETQTSPRLSCWFKVTVLAAKPESKTVKFEQHNRSVCTYISVWGKARIPMLKAADISPTSLIGSLELPVYYQKHVLDRLYERIDCFPPAILKGEMDISLTQPKLTPLGDMRALLTYTFYGYKLGYFVVEVIEGIAVLRTFLFLTNDGTPEGERLKRNLGVSKMDKTYTRLDRLSTFLHSDIKDDKQLHELLKESGCDGLMHTDSALISASTKSTAGIDAYSLRKYLLSDSNSDVKDKSETVTCVT